MKRFRLPLLIAAAALVLVAVALVLVFSSRFQTWAARRAIAAQSGLNLTLGSVDAGWHRVTVTDLRWEQNGLVVTAPTVQADLSAVSAAFHQRYAIKRLLAKGWTVTFKEPPDDQAVPSTRSESPQSMPPIPAAAAYATGATLHAFAGVFEHLRLPVDLALDQVEFEGAILLPENRGRADLTITGGGLSPTSQGRFDLQAGASIVDPVVNRIEVRGDLRAGMDTPRTFNRLGLNLEATASGPQLPGRVTLTSAATAERAESGESYSATLTSHERQLLAIRAELPRDANRISGSWRLDARDADVAPFALGHPLPVFTLTGEGRFDADPSFSAVHASGTLGGTTDRLDVLSAELAALGATTFTADFDVAQRERTVSVRQFEASISSAHPVATVRSLQAFAFDASTGELSASDPTRDLFGIRIEAMPVTWVNPWIQAANLESGTLRGDFVASARAGGVALRSREPVTIERLSFEPAGKATWRDLDLTLGVNANHTPQGWQAEVTGLTVRSNTSTILMLDAKAGQLSGNGQAIKAAGKLSTNLVGLLRLVDQDDEFPLTSGEASVEFVASMNEKTELHARVALRDLAANVGGVVQRFPVLTTDLRADIKPTGEMALNAPIVLEHAGRISDLTFVGTIGATRNGSRSIDGQVTSSHLVLDDARILAALIPPDRGDELESPRPAAPPWASLHGALALQLKRVVLTDTFEMTNVGGRLRLDAGTVKLETVQAGMGGSGHAAVDGELSFNPLRPQPFRISADVKVREFDPGPLLRTLSGGQPPTIEGQFDVVGKLTGRAGALEELPSVLGGEFQLTSKGGIFRGLPVNANNLAETTSRIAAFITSAGAALGALTGRRDYVDVANKAEAVAELARSLSAIKYDQLSLTLSRDEALNTAVRNFSAISPEIRLTGGGVAMHTPGTPFTDDALEMEFTLRVRGRQAELLRYLGVLEPEADDLGYAACTVPVKIGGTVGEPDATEFSHRIASLTLEKSGLTEKAAEFLGRIRGGK